MGNNDGVRKNIQMKSKFNCCTSSKNNRIYYLTEMRVNENYILDFFYFVYMALQRDISMSLLPFSWNKERKNIKELFDFIKKERDWKKT